MSHVSYLMSHGLFLMSHGLFTVPQKPPHRLKTTMFPRPGMTPKSRWKFINFRAGLQGNKSHENWSQGHPKSWKIDPGIMRNPISTKVDFCNTFHAKCLFFQSQTPQFRPKNQQKKQPGNRYEKNCFFCPKVPKKLSEWVPKITKKSTKSKPGPHRPLPCALQCPRIVPGSSQGPPGCKVEAPSMPNDTHRHHKPKNWLQNCQKSSIQEPASQHIVQQRSLIKQKPTNAKTPNQ